MMRWIFSFFVILTPKVTHLLRRTPLLFALTIILPRSKCLQKLCPLAFGDGGVEGREWGGSHDSLRSRLPFFCRVV